MPAPVAKFFKQLTGVVVALALLGGVLLGAFQLAVTRVPAYRTQLQQFLEQRTGLAVEFRELGARLRWAGPELVFKDLVVRTPDRTYILASAKRATAGVALWRSIAAWRLIAERVTLTYPRIDLIRTRSGAIELVGQSVLPARSFTLDTLPLGRLQVRAARVSFRDAASGRGPWVVAGVNFTLDRQRQLLDVRGFTALPAALGRSLEFAARAHGKLGDSATLFSTVTIAGEGIDLTGWADLLPDGWPAPESGQGAVRISTAFRGSALTNLSAQVDLRNVTAVAPAESIPLPQPEPLTVAAAPQIGPSWEPAPASTMPTAAVDAATGDGNAAPTAELISYQRVAFALRAQQRAQGWELALSDVEATRAGAAWQAAAIQLHWTRADAGGFALSGQADRVVLQNVWPLLAYLPRSDRVAYLRALRAEGVVNDLAFDFKRAAADKDLQFTIRAGLQGVSISPVLKTPGLRAISGALQASETGGELQLDSRELQFNLPRMFRAPWSMRAVDGRLAWRREPESWRVSGAALRIDGADGVDGRAQAAFTLTVPHDGTSPVLDLRARGENLAATVIAKYLPANKLSAKTLQWLDNAFTSGQVIDSEVIIKGPLRSFPFRRREGEFSARARVAGIAFNYQTGWAPATGLAADVEFRNAGVRASAVDAQVGGLRVRGAQGEFPDFRKGEIAVKADATGDLGQALALLRSSPVAAALGPLFAKLRGDGTIHSSVELWLPLRHIADRRIAVTTQLKEATAFIEGVNAPLTEITGSLTVQQALLNNALLHGRWLGGPMSLQITQDGATHAALTAQGHALAAQLAPFLPATVQVSGATDWQLVSQIRAGQSSEESSGREPQVWRIAAGLDGLGIALPDPLGKAEQGARPLQVDLEVGEALLARVSYDAVRALLRIRHGDGRWTFDRGGVRADGVAAALPAHRGLRVEGDVERIVLDDWFALRGAPAASGSKLADFLQAANVRVGELNLYGYRWADVRGVLQATPAGWRIDVAGPDASGQVEIPQSFSAEAPLTASLERLVLRQQEPERRSAKTQRDPRAWPHLRIRVADLWVDEHAVGELELKATRVDQGLHIDSVSITQPQAQGAANGQWLLTPEGERSNLSLKILSTDVGATLRSLNYTPFMEARRGEVRAELAWAGGFDSHFLEHASGSLNVEADAGQLAALQPGAGRVLGLFSVAALPRRLALDFSDLTEKGLSFDTVRGDFDLREGNAYTSNLLLRGPAAEIGIAGRTGIAAHDYDQTAIVTGNLGASLPVAGALAGGPAIGAALLLFSQVFKEPLKGITRGYYRITGSWDDPIVERVEAAALKETATSTLAR